MPIGIGLLGLGTVGAGVAEILLSPQGRHPLVADLELRQVAVRDLNRPRPIPLSNSLLTTDPAALVANPDVDLVVEVMGGLEPARSLILAAIEAGKAVVTANKAVLAAHGNELMSGHGQQLLRFEAAVAGAIPIIQGMSGGLAANRLASLFGIINGTSNYIFGEMEANGTAFDEVLAEAQRLGYAEAEPSFDIDGIDAAHKLTILLALGFTGAFDLSSVFIEGIRHVTVADIRFAAELGYKIKHLGIIQNTDAGVEARVHCALVPSNALLANVNGVMNAVQINSDGAGETLFSGPGAGGEATASAVLSDVLALGKQMSSGNGIGVLPESDANNDQPSRLPVLVSMDDVASANYLRIPTVDQPGVFAKVTQALSEFAISIDAAIQHEASSDQAAVDIVLRTNEVVEATMNAALERLQSLDIVVADIVRLRVAPTL